MARTLILRVPAGTPVGPLCETLAQITTVESASPNYCRGHAVRRAPRRSGRRIEPRRLGAAPDWSALLEAHAIEPGDRRP